MNNRQLQKSLCKIVKGQVLQQKEILNFYSVDASLYQVFPKVVIIPKNENDIISIVKFANKNKISVTVRGAGTGLVGNSLNSGIILDLKNLNAATLTKNAVKVQPGVMKGNLDALLEKKQKYFPPNPSIGPYCSLGGIIGNNASGSRTIKYGSAIDQISEITFIDGKGNRITLPSNKKLGKKILRISQQAELDKFPKTSKNSCGYRIDKVQTIRDTHKILVGSEGTLGIIVSAKLNVKNIPQKKLLFIIEYDSLQTLAKDCYLIKETSPSAIEFVDKQTLRNFNIGFNKKTNALLFVEYDSDLEFNGRKLRKIINSKLIMKIKTDSEIKQWWKFRDRALSYSLKSIKLEYRVPHIIEDAAVPLEKLGALFLLIQKLNQKFRTKTVMYGHAGNGNIHVRIISKRKKITALEKIAKEYFDNVIKLGGTITAEHGDGIARSEFVEKQYGGKNYKIFKELKKIFDPNFILNPGKITSHKNQLKIIEKF